jgi:hypothetical protein
LNTKHIENNINNNENEFSNRILNIGEDTNYDELLKKDEEYEEEYISKLRSFTFIS